MGRKRSIDRDELMAAVERVVRRSGVPGLSIDAVAKEAGISKSSVLYDCESKAGLLAQFTRRQMEMHREALDACIERYRGQPNPTLRGMIDDFRQAPTEEDLAVAMSICASMGENALCRDVMREKIVGAACDVGQEAGDRNRMLTVLLTLHGIAFLEYFGFHRFDDETRNGILDELSRVAESDAGVTSPEAPETPSSQ